jgi:hypothetical protein
MFRLFLLFFRIWRHLTRSFSSEKAPRVLVVIVAAVTGTKTGTRRAVVVGMNIGIVGKSATKIATDPENEIRRSIATGTGTGREMKIEKETSSAGAGTGTGIAPPPLRQAQILRAPSKLNRRDGQP